MSEQDPNEAAVLRAVESCVLAVAHGGPLAQKLDAYYRATAQQDPAAVSKMEYAIRRQILSVCWQRDAGVVAPWLDIVNPSGYVREPALRCLEGPAPNLFLLVMLMRRLNDWVLQVRQAASAALDRFVAQTPAQVMADALFAVLPQCLWWGRVDGSGSTQLLEICSRPRIADASR